MIVRLHEMANNSASPVALQARGTRNWDSNLPDRKRLSLSKTAAV